MRPAPSAVRRRGGQAHPGGIRDRLAEHPTAVVTKRELLASVSSYPADARTRTLDSRARRLRQKLADAGAPGLIVNVWGDRR